MVAEAISDKVLQDIPIFHDLNATERAQLAEVIRVREYKPGDVILHQGKECRNLWIVVEGKCEVVRHIGTDGANEEEPVMLALLEPYSQFGEMSFFHPAPHSADVRAKTRVKLFRITRVDFQDLIDEGVTAAYKLAHTAVQSMAQRLRRMDEWIGELLAHQPAQPQLRANGTTSARSYSIAGIFKYQRNSDSGAG